MVETKKVRGAGESRGFIVAHCRRHWRSQVAAGEPAAEAALVAMAAFAEMAGEPTVAARDDNDSPPTMVPSTRRTTAATLPPKPPPAATTVSTTFASLPTTTATISISSLISQARECSLSRLFLILVLGMHVAHMTGAALAELYGSPMDFPIDELRAMRRTRDTDSSRQQQQSEILNNVGNEPADISSSSSGDSSENSREARIARLRQWVRALNETLDEKSLEAFSEISDQGKGKSLLFESKVLNQDQLYGRIIRENMTRKYEGNLYAWKIGHIVLMQNETAILVVCASIPRYYYWEFAQTASTVIIFCMIVVGNLSVLHRLKSCRRRRSNVNYFIVQLAIADLFVGFFSVTLDSLWRFQKMFAYGPVACRASKYISVLFIYSSTYLLVALSIDRWEAVVKPLAFTQNRSRGYYLVLGAWLLAFVGATPVTLHTTIKDVEGLPQCFIDLTQRGWKVYMVYLTCSLLAVPALIIAICYTHIVFTIWSKGRLVQKQQKCKLREEQLGCKKQKQSLIEASDMGGRSSVINNTSISDNDLLTVALDTTDTTVAVTTTTKLNSTSTSGSDQQQQQQRLGQGRRHLGSQQRRKPLKQSPDLDNNGKQADVHGEIAQSYDEDSLSQYTEDEYLSSSDDDYEEDEDEELEDEDDKYDYYDEEEQAEGEEAVEASTAAVSASIAISSNDGNFNNTAGRELVGERANQLAGEPEDGLELCEMVAGQVAPGDKHTNQRVSVRIRPTPTVMGAGGGSTKRNSTRAGQAPHGIILRDPSQASLKLKGTATTKMGIRTTKGKTKTTMMTEAQQQQPLTANRTKCTSTSTTTATAASTASSASASATTNNHAATATGSSSNHHARKRLSKGAKKARRSYAAGQQHGSGVIPKARIKTIKMTLVIVAVFILCWAPFYIINLCSVFGLMPKDTSFAFAIKTLSQSLAHLNSAVNPIIFWMFSSKQRGKTVVVSSAADVRKRLNIAPEKG